MVWKTAQQDLKKSGIELPYDIAGLLLSAHKALKARLKLIHTPMCIASLIARARRWKQPKCPSTDD